MYCRTLKHSFGTCFADSTFMSNIIITHATPDNTGHNPQETNIVSPSTELKPSLLRDKFGHAPVFKTAVWEISSDDERNFSLGKLF